MIVAIIMAQNIDFLPKCPLCTVSLYCIGIETKKLQCGHFYCQLCIGKLKVNQGYKCSFDGKYSENAENWGDLTSYWEQFLTGCRTAQELQYALKTHLGYDSAILPCKRLGCPGNCGCTHSIWKTAECPFSYRCPNAERCIFRHPGEEPTIPLSTGNTQKSWEVYSEVTAPKRCNEPVSLPPKSIWYCRNCGAGNKGSTCSQCSCIWFS